MILLPDNYFIIFGYDIAIKKKMYLNTKKYISL